MENIKFPIVFQVLYRGLVLKILMLQWFSNGLGVVGTTNVDFAIIFQLFLSRRVWKKLMFHWFLNNSGRRESRRGLTSQVSAPRKVLPVGRRGGFAL